jgi:hypothetical protein
MTNSNRHWHCHSKPIPWHKYTVTMIITGICVKIVALFWFSYSCMYVSTDFNNYLLYQYHFSIIPFLFRFSASQNWRLAWVLMRFVADFSFISEWEQEEKACYGKCLWNTRLHIRLSKHCRWLSTYVHFSVVTIEKKEKVEAGYERFKNDASDDSILMWFDLNVFYHGFYFYYYYYFQLLLYFIECVSEICPGAISSITWVFAESIDHRRIP